MAQVKHIGNFTPLTELVMQTRRPGVLNDPTLLDPDNAVCLYDGEWIKLNASEKVVRVTDITSLGDPHTAAMGEGVYPVWAERGRTDVRSMPDPAVPYILSKGGTEWFTRIYDAAVTVGSGAPITFVGQPLKIATISLTSPQGTRKFCGLVGAGAKGTDAAPVVAYVRGLPANNNSRLRIELVNTHLAAAGPLHGHIKRKLRCSTSPSPHPSSKRSPPPMGRPAPTRSVRSSSSTACVSDPSLAPSSTPSPSPVTSARSAPGTTPW